MAECALCRSVRRRSSVARCAHFQNACIRERSWDSASQPLNTLEFITCMIAQSPAGRPHRKLSRCMQERASIVSDTCVRSVEVRYVQLHNARNVLPNGLLLGAEEQNQWVVGAGRRDRGRQQS